MSARVARRVRPCLPALAFALGPAALAVAGAAPPSPTALTASRVVGQALDPGLPVIRLKDLPHGETFAQAGANPQLWMAGERLRDVRYDGARDVAADVRAGEARRVLPFTILSDGQPVGDLLIGAGFIEMGGDGRRGPRIDVLSGDGVEVTGPVLLVEGPLRAAIRWTSLEIPGVGTAAAEIVLDPFGHVTVQYLLLPGGATHLFRSGALRSSAVSASGPMPRGASSFHLAEGSWNLGLPGRPARPAAEGDPPATCPTPSLTTWCDIADGDGTTTFYMKESFDDGASAGRGWTGSDQWHEVSFDTCPPGATFSPGRAWYYGQDASCQYVENSVGVLASPPTTLGISANTYAFFRQRLSKQEPSDIASVYINGVGMVSFDSTGADPDTWYEWTFDPPDLVPFVGSAIFIEWIFQSDALTNGLGWGIDDIVIYDPTTAINANCVIDAGLSGNTPCDTRVTDSWQFWENQFCQQCTYTFYALVECGREMHLPLLDMEGADVTITHALTGTRVPLTCRNSTWYANRGLGLYRGITADCCPAPTGDGVLDIWYGPEMDVTDPTGHVRWGLDSFPTPCPSVAIYDVGGDGLGCNDLPCPGGLLPLLSPGENQVMDCFIESPTGLCGIYRVDVVSGGFAWNLFANCNGDSAPQFPIFFDCTEAWTAYNPLPEVAVENLVTVGDCFPDLTVSFDLVNIGCADVPVGQDIVARITSDCAPVPDVKEIRIATGLPVGGRVSVVDEPFPPACLPVRIEVFADPVDLLPPGGLIDECTESITVASCRAEEGVDSLATFTCGCTANLTADAGLDRLACANEAITLDGGDSILAPCAVPLYRWTDSTGRLIQDWNISPTTTTPFTGCPDVLDYTLDVQCQGETCIDSDVVRVTCVAPVAVASADVLGCVGEIVQLSGDLSTIASCTNITYSWFNPSGTQVQSGPSPTLSLGQLSCDEAGTYRLQVSCADGGACSDSDTVEVRCVEVIGEILAGTLTTCEGAPFQVVPTDIQTTSTGCAVVEYAWYDGVSGAPLEDADGDGVPDTYYTDPTSPPLVFAPCPGQGLLALEARCQERPTCGTIDFVIVDCPRPLDPVPTYAQVCGGAAAQLDCGVAEAGTTYGWDTDITVDTLPLPVPDGNPGNDLDILGSCTPLATWPTPGTRTVRAVAINAAGCVAFVDMDVTAFADPQVPAPTFTPACVGETMTFDCGVFPVEPDTTYAWDFDIFVDSDNDGFSDNDVDATGCGPVDHVYAAGGIVTARVTATATKPGGPTCTVVGDVLVSPDAPPPPAEIPTTSLRVTRAGASLTVTWAAAADAITYRVLRGPLAVPWAYDHDADPTARGTCDSAGLLTHTDPDDASDGELYYYLVTGVNRCGIEGTAGFGLRVAPFERPPRTAAPDACP